MGDNQDPRCFGDLKTVFPLGPDGLRLSPETCLKCDRKTRCLRSALAQKEGLRMRAAIVDRAYDSGMIGFFQRWSRKKIIHHRLKKTDAKDAP